MRELIAIVTGASSGFGLLISIELAKAGFHVIATMRNTEKRTGLLSTAEKLNLLQRITIQELDVTSESSVENLKTTIQEVGRVDVLVNNAGYAAGGFVEEIDLNEYRKQFETNVFGVIAVTKTVLPWMRQQKQGKIINVSSISGKVGFPGLSPYVASKYALEGFSESLRLEMKPFGVDVVLIEPGSYRTNIWSTGKQVTDSLEDSPYYPLMKKIENYLAASESQYGDPLEVAKKIAEVAAMKDPHFRYPIGKGVKATVIIKNFLSWKRWENIILKSLHKK